MGSFRSGPPIEVTSRTRRTGGAVALLLGCGLAAIAACDNAPAQPRVLVSYDFSVAREDSLYGSTLGDDRGLHSFGEGWATPNGEAVWTLGPRAIARLTLLGRDLRLRLRCSTSPQLVERGQEVTLLWNGNEVLRRTLPHQWRVDTLEVAIPDVLVNEGTNELELLASEHLTEADGESAPRAVYVHGIIVVGLLDAQERRRWETWSTPAGPDPEWRTVRIPPDPRTAHLPARTDFGPTQPDLLVVVLDAARADHLSCYGYDRDTTPHIDALAADGVRLERMFAEAPYTRSSIATFFTAHSWRDHGVLGSEHALDPGFVTLAEILQEAGYRTVGVTDNANVAVSAGSAQGFDEWIQTWSDHRRRPPAGRESWWPELPAILWRERLQQGLSEDRPVFAYVHLMPPHEPYSPGPEHDLFGPEGYEGPVVGHTPDIRAFDRGEIPCGGVDHERLVALYDGHLHRGDSIVASVLAAWRATARRRPTLTVVLSDHGEAFGEHGRFGHNSSPHDEMLHVPFVMHPVSLVPETIRSTPGALRSLGDALPLLLHTLGVPLPRGTTWPRRVLEVMEDPAAPRRAVFVRCAQPLYARRSADALTILGPWSRQEHFDLGFDPGATQDLRWRRPSDYLEALVELRAFVETPATLPGAVEAELRPEDVERLKALGYL